MALNSLSKKFLKESSEKIVHALLMTQISKEDYTDFPDFSMNSISV